MLNLEAQRIHITKLPYDVLALIFSNLKLTDIGSCTRVCKEWNKIAMNEQLWRNLSNRDFPKAKYIGPSWREHYESFVASPGKLNPVVLTKLPKLKKGEGRLNVKVVHKQENSHNLKVIVGNATVGKTCYLTAYT